MKYFIDTEFIEGIQTKRIPLINWKYGKTKPTIDLISIGIVTEDNRELYLVSKDFNVYEAWNRFQIEIENNKTVKTYWIRDNVLKPIFYDLIAKDNNSYYLSIGSLKAFKDMKISNNYIHFKELINKYGKTNKYIAKAIYHLVNPELLTPNLSKNAKISNDTNPEFYAYYADYDWVAFCWLFGNMIDLPNGFPMYCIDLKQILDNIAFKVRSDKDIKTHEDKINLLKAMHTYPKQKNEHNALDDARWNLKLFNFLKRI